MRMDGQTDSMTRLTVALRNFANVTKPNCCFLNCWITKFIFHISRYFNRCKIWLWCQWLTFLFLIQIKVIIMNFSCNKINTDWLPKPCMHIFVPESTAPVGLDLCVVPLSHSGTAHTVGLVSTSDRLVAESSTWQHTTLIRDRPSCLRGDSNP